MACSLATLLFFPGLENLVPIFGTGIVLQKGLVLEN
jgi:hypothetical protein